MGLLVCLMVAATVSCRPLAKGPPEPEEDAPQRRATSPAGVPSFAWPLAGDKKPRVVCPFGTRSVSPGGTRQPHAGVDLAVVSGAEVRAAAAGRVAYVGERPLFGLVVIVDHGNRWHSVYANLEKVKVSSGETVESRTVLGIVGSECDTGDGRCLHFEIRHRGDAVDPEACVAR